MEDLVEEAGRLVDGGAKELILVAQETTVYGVDLYGQKMLPELLRRLCRLEGLAWIRVLYCYPEEITEELIQVMKKKRRSVTIWIFRSSTVRCCPEADGKKNRPGGTHRPDR